MQPSTEKIKRVQCTDCARKQWEDFAKKIKED